MTKTKSNQPSKEAGQESILKRTAKAIGSALGTIAAKTGIGEKPASASPAVVEKKPSPPKKAAARKRKASPRKKS